MSEAQFSEPYIRIPAAAYKWLMGEEGDFTCPMPSAGNFWWRSEFQRRIKDFRFVASDLAMDRASTPEMFNVVGDELRRLGAEVAKLGARLDGDFKLSDQRWEVMHDRVGAIEARLSDLKVLESYIKGLGMTLHDAILPKLTAAEQSRLSLGNAVIAMREELKIGVLAQDIGKVFDRMEKRFDALEQRMMLDRIAAAARISSKTLGLPRKAGKRPARKNGNA